ncbi:pyridoxamine 5'-phosphate oxidase family protein [Nisaea acidiphila]|uniref:Pyridoxamine 5'-phosphate oxidase family protein n=1 Tax=Nisaea acidiphila TaxID=1862145 RepID=A0A9J7ASZ1_9PROT|nr:pyridoxamine 5'-phosphate oxidase family protein [Nisaea acidiphila]UUX50294.1 pyridoxamine 5'-phosphate oxidase family protein [Nisaea acidiphila]
MSSRHGADAEELLEKAIDLLGAAPVDRNAPFRYPVLATADGSGGADARTLILRSFEREHWRVTLHTDRRSAKIRELGTPQTVTLVFYDHGVGLQVRLRGRIAVVGDDCKRHAAWEALPPSNRRNYLAAHPPGTPLPAPGDGIPENNPGGGFENFAVLGFAPDSVDILKLSPEGNRRYRLAPPNGSGSWLVP